MESGIWSRFRGRKDGESWSSLASDRELAAWADISSFEYYMGAMPFPFDIETAVACYERARSDAREAGVVFEHRHYATGFLGVVYEAWQQAQAGL